MKQYGLYATSICSGSTCTYTPSYTLPIGSFSWTVKARDVNREGGWSPRTAFSVVAPPAPVAIGPSGAITTPTPTYSWNTTAGATSYAFEAFAADETKVFFLIVDAAGACSGSTCAWTPGVTLTAGSYWWHVKGRHASGTGAWSAAMNFTAQVPPAPATGGPAGYTLDPKPTYNWTTATAATGYTLEAFDGADARQFRHDYSSSSVCSGTSCAVRPDETLAIGEYTWHVRGTNAIGGGVWSAAKPFSVNGPPAPVTVSPSGIVRVAQLPFSWRPASGATGYQLEVLREDETRRFIELSIPGSVCGSDNTCAFTSGSILEVGEYTWHVRGTHAGGGGAWSAKVPISIRGPAPPLLGSPNGNTYDPQPVYTWSASSGATSYRLQTVNSEADNEYMVDYAASSVCDAAGACAARPGTALTAGQYSWHMRSIGSVGLGEWSAARSFAVLAPPAATLLSPAGHTYEATPVFTWTASPYATDYWLELFDVSDPDVSVSLLKRLVTAQSVCSGNACSLAPDKGLASGPYRWNLVAKSAAGGTLARLDFTVLRPTAPTLLSPSGITENATPSFMWTVSTGATWYRLRISRDDDSTVWQGYVQTTSCSGGVCTGAPGKLLTPGAYVWKAVAQSAAGGTDGVPMGFTVRRPLAVVLLFPGGTLSDSTPTYTWRPTGATSYLLAVDASGGREVTRVWYSAATSCTQNVCLAQPGTSLSLGSYNWFVHPADAGIQSNVKAFSIVEVPLPPGDPSLPEQVRFYHTDPLGSVRMVTDNLGSVVARYDFFPFGEQIPSTLSGRASVPGYSADAGNKHRFTGKLRDFEGGALPLDYFGARYYSAPQGRFSSVDPVKMTPVRLLDPQRLSLYSYVRNNPLRYVDPKGEDVYLANADEEGRRRALASITVSLRVREQRNVGYRRIAAGKYEIYLKEPGAIAGAKASAGYRYLSGMISDSSIRANLHFVPKGGSARGQDGTVYSHHALCCGSGSRAGEGAVTAGLNAFYGQGNIDVFVPEGGAPRGVSGLTASGKDVGIAMPDFIITAHELFGESFKYMRGNEALQQDVIADSDKVIGIENEIRQFHGLPLRSGKGHGYVREEVTVTP